MLKLIPTIKKYAVMHFMHIYRASAVLRQRCLYEALSQVILASYCLIECPISKLDESCHQR
jgi:hypothetical protein